jgi:hypothetical protein
MNVRIEFLQFMITNHFIKFETSPRREERSHKFLTGCIAGDFSLRRNDDLTLFKKISLNKKYNYATHKCRSKLTGNKTAHGV